MFLEKRVGEESYVKSIPQTRKTRNVESGRRSENEDLWTYGRRIKKKKKE